MICPICNQPVDDDEPQAAFREYPDVKFHVECLEKFGYKQALKVLQERERGGEE